MDSCLLQGGVIMDMTNQYVLDVSYWTGEFGYLSFWGSVVTLEVYEGMPGR